MHQVIYSRIQTPFLCQSHCPVAQDNKLDMNSHTPEEGPDDGLDRIEKLTIRPRKGRSRCKPRGRPCSSSSWRETGCSHMNNWAPRGDPCAPCIRKHPRQSTGQRRRRRCSSTWQRRLNTAAAAAAAVRNIPLKSQFLGLNIPPCDQAQLQLQTERMPGRQ